MTPTINTSVTIFDPVVNELSDHALLYAWTSVVEYVVIKGDGVKADSVHASPIAIINVPGIGVVVVIVVVVSVVDVVLVSIVVDGWEVPVSVLVVVVVVVDVVSKQAKGSIVAHVKDGANTCE